MSPSVEPFPRPASREPMALLSVDRAAGELRRGRAVVIAGGGGEAVLALAGEAASTAAIRLFFGDIEPKMLRVAVTQRRAAALGFTVPPGRAAVISAVSAPGALDGPLGAEAVLWLADPARPGAQDDTIVNTRELKAEAAPLHGCAQAAAALARIAGLLPAAAICGLDTGALGDAAVWAHRRDLFTVDAGDVFQHQAARARTLTLAGEARVPLAGAEDTRVLAFRPADGGLEHLAVVIGTPDPAAPVLTRIHSECFTGDLLGSLRCDCGEQLRGAVREIAAAGAGVLLYLAQEGRGIGLVNKLRAYALQDRGFDTVDANEMLGFDADERVYLPAARMLRALGFTAVRLMTNNPDKVAALKACGVDVAQRVPHAFPANAHNEHYLRTKAKKAGHLF
ncbi:MAG: GTP cyclohydrolase II [Rhodospirillales bacterium]